MIAIVHGYLEMVPPHREVSSSCRIDRQSAMSVAQSANVGPVTVDEYAGAQAVSKVIQTVDRR